MKRYLLAVLAERLKVSATALPTVERRVKFDLTSPSSKKVTLWAFKSKPSSPALRPLR